MERRTIALALCVVLGAGCTASGGPAAGVLPSQTQVATAAGAAIAVRIPLHVEAAPRPHDVSRSTQSAALAVTPAAGCTTCGKASTDSFGLTPSSKGCTTAAAQIACTLYLGLDPGTYTASFTTYDGPLNGKHQPTGRILSLDQKFPIVVTAGKVKTISVTLAGVPHALAVQTITGSTVDNPPPVPDLLPVLFVAAGTTGSEELLAQDADNNLILGPGAPSFAVTATNGWAAGIHANVLDVTPPKTPSEYEGTVAITLKGPGCSAKGATCTFALGTYLDSLAAVANAGNNTVAVFPNLALTSGSGAPYATIEKGIDDPVAVQFEIQAAATGNLFVANRGNNTVSRYAPPYTGAPIATLKSGIDRPIALAYSIEGNLAVINQGNNTVEVFEPPYTGAPVVIHTAGLGAFSIAFDDSGNLWIAVPSTNSVLQYTASSGYANNAISLGSSANGIDDPVAIAVDIASNLYVAEGGDKEIDEYTLATSYSGHPAATQTLQPGLTSFALSEENQGPYLAACASGQTTVFDGTFQVVTQKKAAATCAAAAFSREKDLLLLYPSSSSVVAYPNTNEYAIPWSGSVTFTSPYLNEPTAIAEWP